MSFRVGETLLSTAISLSLREHMWMGWSAVTRLVESFAATLPEENVADPADAARGGRAGRNPPNYETLDLRVGALEKAAALFALTGSPRCAQRGLLDWRRGAHDERSG